MSETLERRQCSVCATLWPADVNVCPRCEMHTHEYTLEVPESALEG